MPEYIDRDTAVKEVMAAKWESGSDGAMAMEIVAAPPAADVEPVRHGRWDLSPASIRRVKKTNIPEAVCSLCGKRFCDITNSVTLYHYCPNCGAKMDGEVEA